MFRKKREKDKKEIEFRKDLIKDVKRKIWNSWRAVCTGNSYE